MAVLLSGVALRRAFGARVLFDNLSLSLSEGDRTGLIGPNGSGKTTLLEILAGNEAPDAGFRALRKQTKLAYVPQDSLFGPDDTVGSVLRAAVEQLHLEEEEKRVRTGVMLDRAGFDTSDTPAAALSGGWKKRLAIAAALVTSPDVLILDEPTNHLDLEGILWLETAIQTVNTCLVVTHDRYFLENVANQMVEINRVYPQGTFQVKGNYSEFLERREEFLEVQAKQQESLATKVRREVEWLRRGPKARTGKSRARVDSAGRLIEELAAATIRSRTATAQIDFTASDRSTKRLIEAEANREDTRRTQAFPKSEPDSCAGCSCRAGGSERKRQDHPAQDTRRSHGAGRRNHPAGGPVANRKLRAGPRRASRSGDQPASSVMPGWRFGNLPRPSDSCRRMGQAVPLSG